MMEQAIKLKSIRNSRELGGYRAADGRQIRKGVLLRTARLYEISDEDIGVLRDVYRLQHIIDLRMAKEASESPDPPIDGAEYHHLDVVDMSYVLESDKPDEDVDLSDPFKVAEMTISSGIQNDRMYIGFLSGDMGKDAYSRFFRVLLSADPGRAVLWHCTSGKDRTGLAAMLMMSALGVDEEIIIRDHLLTNEYNADRIAATARLMREKGYDEDFIEQAVLVFDAVDGSYMRNAIGYLREEYGSPVGYIRDALGISPEEIEILKDKYLV